MSARRELAAYAPRSEPRPACPASVRRGVAQDVEEAAALSLTVGTGTQRQWRDRLQHDVDLPDGELVVARVGGELAGCARVGLGFRVVWRGDIGFPGLPPGSRDVLVQRLL